MFDRLAEHDRAHSVVALVYLYTAVYMASSFFPSVLRWSVAVSTICRHSSQVVAFLQAVARPNFRGPSSASIAWSQVWLGLPASRFQSGGTCQIHVLQGLDDGPHEVNYEQYGQRATDVY